jgi:D-sedoheptulose 7-phosphate isomerase
MSANTDEIRRQLVESARVKQAFSDALVVRIADFAQRSAEAIRRGGKLVFFGNGGSAADAQHLAAELVVLTAAGNDYGFERIFSRQMESLVGPHDVVVALSTSGTSPNIIKGMETARTRGSFLVALTGESGGALAGKVDILLDVPSRDPQRIQESHITIGHIVCSLIEHSVAAN